MDGGILVKYLSLVQCHKLVNTFFLSRNVGVQALVVFLNKVDMVDDEELLDC